MTIREFLAGIGLEQYTEVFEENGIEVEILPELEESDLPDLGIKLLGHRKKLMKAIRLQGPSSKELAAAGTSQPAASAAPQPAAPAPIPAAQTKPDLNDTAVQPVAVAPRSVPAPAPAPVPAPEKVKRRVSRQDLVSTIVEQATSPVASAASSSPAPTPQSSQRIKRLKRSSIERIPAATDPNAAPTPKESKPADQAAPVAPRRKKKQSGFSETQWFMAGASQDADILEAQSDQVDYDHDASISEEDRKGFTLREDGE